MNVEVPVSAAPIVNEGPLTRGEVENSMILIDNQPKLIGEIRFNPEQQNESVIPEVFLEAFETPERKIRRIYEELKDQPSLTEEMLHRAFLTAAAVSKSPQAFGWPGADLEYITSVLQGQSVVSEAESLVQQTASFPISVAQEKQTQKALPQKANHIFEQRAHKIVQLSEEQDIDFKRKRFVLDEAALGVVKTEIRAAVRKASVLAKELGVKLTGPLIRRFLPEQHAGNESEAVKGKGMDGSIPERAEDIEKRREFETYEEAEEFSLEVVDEKPPIKIRKEGEGKPVKDEDVYRVFQSHAVKPVSDELDSYERLTA